MSLHGDPQNVARQGEYVTELETFEAFVCLADRWERVHVRNRPKGARPDSIYELLNRLAQGSNSECESQD